jgi:DNA-binding GntR family transcriptional regulator
VHLLEDILPARLLVLEFATRVAVERADESDISRLRDITDLLIAAFERGEPMVIAHGFQRWLDGLVDASHSVAVRWIANPFLEAYRELMDRFPGLWVLEPTFPQYLREFIDALAREDADRALSLTRAYYERVDGAFMKTLELIMQARKSSPVAAPTPVKDAGES